jgi:transcriptional regulator with XRE-family HTH domain
LKKKNEISLLVGKKIRCLRQDRGLTMEQLAFEVGIEYTQLSRIERGVINTSIYQLFVISRALQVEFAEIVSDLDLVDFQFE